jgi:hypothetical protein
MATNGSGNGAAPAINGRAYPIEDHTYDVTARHDYPPEDHRLLRALDRRLFCTSRGLAKLPLV